MRPRPNRRNAGRYEQALHLAGIRVVSIGQRPEGATAGDGTVDDGQQHEAAWGGIGTGQPGQFLVEALEVEIDVKAVRVVVQDEAGFVPVRGGLGRDEQDLGGGHD